MKKNIVLIVLIVLLCVGAYWSCHQLSRNKAVEAVLPDDTQKLLADLQTTEQAYNARIDSLDAINYSLQVKVNKTQVVLSEVKKENSNLKQTINDLLDIHYTSTDTLQKLENCDSLAVAMQDMLLLDITKDSIYENLSTDLKQQLVLKDSVIAIRENQYDILESNYTTLIHQKQQLLQENASLQKAVKKQKVHKGLLGTVLAAVGGLFVFHSLQ